MGGKNKYKYMNPDERIQKIKSILRDLVDMGDLPYYDKDYKLGRLAQELYTLIFER